MSDAIVAFARNVVSGEWRQRGYLGGFSFNPDSGHSTPIWLLGPAQQSAGGIVYAKLGWQHNGLNLAALEYPAS